MVPGFKLLPDIVIKSVSFVKIVMLRLVPEFVFMNILEVTPEQLHDFVHKIPLIIPIDKPAIFGFFEPVNIIHYADVWGGIFCIALMLKVCPGDISMVVD